MRCFQRSATHALTAMSSAEEAEEEDCDTLARSAERRRCAAALQQRQFRAAGIFRSRITLLARCACRLVHLHAGKKLFEPSDDTERPLFQERMESIEMSTLAAA